MEGVVIEVRMREPCKRFAIKGHALAIALHVVLTVTSESSTTFFPLRTIRVVTRHKH
jgi:hypothetical protein